MSRRCMGCMEMIENETVVCPHCGYAAGTPAEEAIHMEPGSFLHDRYIVGKVLGYGGFGVTYIGWDGRLEQKVAIKEYLPGEFSTRMPGHTQVTVFNGEKSEQFHDGLKKFVEEARHLAKFQNEPGIVKIFDAFEENDTAYIIMEYLDGMTLTEYLNQVGTIPEDDAVDMLMPLMTSLQTVHAEGLLHRDIAPDNIFITKKGEIKLIDFGASRYATTSHSRSLTVIIKPGYSPEEQYRSRGDQGPYTDVYALSAVLYKMITGKTPPDAMERRAKFENQNKDILAEPHTLKKDISRNRENAILNALNVRIEDRTPDVATFIKELEYDKPVARVGGRIKRLDLYTWPLWLKILVPALLTAVVTFGILLAAGVIDLSRYTDKVVIPNGIVAVPEVEGLTSEEAIKLIEEKNLLAVTDGAVASEYIDAGLIVLQTPTGGSYVNVSGKVGLTVSSGAGVVPPMNGMSTVPYVLWDDRETALSKLEKAGLTAEVAEEYDDNVAAGQVMVQSENAGTQLKEGSTVKLTVSRGTKPFAMPGVTGKIREDAETELILAGLAVNTEYRHDNQVEEGRVISQDPAEGTDVTRGSTVTIYVSSGRETVQVPDVTGMAQADAEKALKDAGFTVKAVENTDEKVKKGTVISQTPEGGSEQLYGAEITIIVSKGPKETQPPTTKKATQAPTRPPVTQAPTQPPETRETPRVGRTLVFNANGGTVSPTSKSVTVGKTYGDLPTPTYSGYTFLGWYDRAEGGSKVTKDTTVASGSGNITIYAHWEKIIQTYTLTFDANGGSVSPSSRTLNAGSAYGDLPTPTRTGYEFNGWYTEKSGGKQVTASTTISGNTTIYAHWDVYVYKLTFDPNGGSVSPTSVYVKYGEAYGSLPTPTRSGYKFEGWYTAASGGKQVTANTTMGAGHVTIYAHWSAATVNVPSFKNQTKSYVQNWCSQNGISASFSEQYYWDTGSVAKGNVISNTTGTVNVGSTISVVLSKGVKALAKGDKVYFSGGKIYGTVGDESSGVSKPAATLWVTGFYQSDWVGVSYSSTLSPRYGWVKKSLLSQRTN